MHYVYVIYSRKADVFYVGETIELEERLHLHRTGRFENAYTKRASDWELYWSIEVANKSIGRKIENHIKRMKSRRYIENLRKYPELGKKLIHRNS